MQLLEADNFSAQGLNPDGAIVDAQGDIWSAQWGSGRIVRYSPGGTELQVVTIPTPQTTCPALGGGGENLDTLYITTAARGIGVGDGTAGRLFQAPVGIRGQAEYRVMLATG